MSNRKNKYFNLLYKRAHRGKGLTGWFWKKAYVLYSEYILGCDIKYTTQIGDGFVIAHAVHGSVVSPSAIIGNNVTLRQNTTIGSKGYDGAGQSPIIGDDVNIDPNVCIIGNVHIGDKSIIGAGAVVVKDVPAGAVVAGNPAKVTRLTNNDVMKNIQGGGKEFGISLLRLVA